MAEFIGDAQNAGVEEFARPLGEKIEDGLARRDDGRLERKDSRQDIARERFHALLAPLPLSPFNAGRSITKIFDAAAVGACGLFSDRAPFRGAVTSGENGLLLADDPARWVAEILRLSENPSDALRLAKGGAALARQLGDPQRLRNFWIERMGLKSSKRFVTPFGDTTKSAK